MVLQAASQCTYNYNKHVNVNLIQLRRATSTPLRGGFGNAPDFWGLKVGKYGNEWPDSEE